MRLQTSSHIKRFYGVGNLSRVPRTVLKELQMLGIATLDCSQQQKNAADIVMVTEIMRSLIEFHPEAICLISNDGGFSHCMNTIGQLGVKTLVLHDQTSRTLSANVSQSFNLCKYYRQHQQQQPHYLHPRGEDEENVPLAHHLAKLMSEKKRDNASASSTSGSTKSQREASKRPGLTHIVTMLEEAGGCMEHRELGRRLGHMPSGWYDNLLRSGQMLHRFTVSNGYIILKESHWRQRNQTGKAGA